MGLNIVAGCHVHKERLWVMRGHESQALRYWFFGPHVQCKRDDPNAVVVSHDQAGDPWLLDEAYRRFWWGASDEVHEDTEVEPVT